MATPYLSRNPLLFRTARQFALLLAMLMSGGNLIVPRIPLLVLGLGVVFLCKGPTLGIRREMWPIGLLLFAVLAVVVLGAGGGYDLVALITRYGAFLMGAALVGLYLDLPAPTLATDLRPMLRLMAIQAALTVVVAAVAGGLFVPFQVQDATYYTFLGLFTFHRTVTETGGFVRPDGFFFEPGVFQIYLNIFLFISLFVTKRLRDIGIAVVGVMATRSTTGVLIMCLLLGGAYLLRFRYASRGERLLAFLAAPVGAAALLIIASQNLLEKTVGVQRGSAWAREYDFRTGLNIIREHPFFGIGFDVDRYREESRRLGYADTQLSFSAAQDRTSSNGLVVLVASVGIPLSLAFFWAMLRQRLFPRPWLFAGLLLMSFVGEALVLTPFFLLIMFSGLLSAGRARVPARPRTGWRPPAAEEPRSA